MISCWKDLIRHVSKVTSPSFFIKLSSKCPTRIQIHRDHARSRSTLTQKVPDLQHCILLHTCFKFGYVWHILTLQVCWVAACWVEAALGWPAWVTSWWAPRRLDSSLIPGT
jgi:hypothetical protein